MASGTSASSSPLPSSFTPPSSILIVGSGVFGLSTALALTRRDAFANCAITIVDRSDPSQPGAFPSPDAASVDHNRIIRADYADPAYAALCDEAQAEWRKQDKPTDLGAQGRYSESGLLLVGDAPPPVPAAAPAVSSGLKPKLTGLDYARLSWANVQALASKDPALAANLRELPTPDAIRDALGTGGTSGSWGYINYNSGWGDAAASMAWLLEQVKQTGRVTFVAGTVLSLAHNDTTVTGAHLADGRLLSADLVIVAAGAWTGALIDLPGLVTATGQVIAYLDLTEAEQAQLANMPVILNLSTGLFIFPPANRTLKIARHAYGYINPVPLSQQQQQQQQQQHNPLPLSPTTPLTPSPISLPLTAHTSPRVTTLPTAAITALRSALQEMVPLPSLLTRPFRATRLCWYSDTPTGDWLIDYHPGWRGLFVATGDSGHAFKFLPVLGERVVDCVVRKGAGEFGGKWRFRGEVAEGARRAAEAAAAMEGGGKVVMVVTEDGSRGGVPGEVLSEALAES